MPKPGDPGRRAFAVLSSGRLALVLVILLNLLALGGVLLPQEGKAEPSDILRWQEGHPGVTTFARPLGLFRVFHSAPFLATIVFLALNTLTCTLRRLFPSQNRLTWRNLKDIRASGFLGLHISLLLLMGGGFRSGATRMDAYLVLTEGQSVKEEAASYIMLAEGPLRRNKHREFRICLAEVTPTYDSNNKLAESSTKLEFESREGRASSGTARVNHPVSFLDLAFTLEETGFAPRLGIRKGGEERPLVDSFVALKTFREGRDRDYRDFLNLPFLGEKIFMRLLPDFELEEGRPAKNGDKPGNPLLQLWTEKDGGEISEEVFVRPGEAAGLAGYDFAFVEFRRWAGFRVVQDSGTAWVLAALWLGLGSLVLRYIPDLKVWFSSQAGDNDSPGGQTENGTS